MKTKKLSLISLILAAVTALSGCSYSQQLTPEVVASIAESAAQSAVEAMIVPEETNVETTVSSENAETTVLPDTETTILSTQETTSDTQTTATEMHTSNGRIATEKLDITPNSIYRFGKQKGKTTETKTPKSTASPVEYGFTQNELSEGVDSTIACYTVPLETNMYGLTAKVKNNKIISVKAFNNSGRKITIKESYIEHTSTLAHDKKHYSNKITFDKYINIDASTLCSYGDKPATYRFMAKFSEGGDIIRTVYLYFILNVNEVWLYSITPDNWTKSQFDQMMNHRQILLDKIAKEKIKPSEQLGVIGTMYLCDYPNTQNCTKNDTTIRKWVKLAKSLANNKMSESLKLYTALKWIHDNMSYDMYTKGKSARRYLYKDYSGKQDAFTTKTGRCLEMSNILVIFCRTYGIPAVTVNNNSHTWTAVYINSRWFEIDPTEILPYLVETNDISVKTKAKYNSTITRAITPFAMARTESDKKFNLIDPKCPINNDLADGNFYY